MAVSSFFQHHIQKIDNFCVALHCSPFFMPANHCPATRLIPIGLADLNRAETSRQ